jgi:hypothetical protein
MLSALVDDTRTDKNTAHSYLDLYQELLSSRKNSAKSVLEVGIHRGGSIKLWYDFFPNATIHALDILHLNEIADDLKNINRIQLYTSTNAYDETFFKKTFIDKNLKFDFMLDDGPHTLETQKEFIRLYSQLMTDDGILIIEDVQSWDWMAILVKQVPEILKPYIMIYDLRDKKKQYDDLVFVIDKKRNPCTLKYVQSFDIFDTLLARTVKVPSDLFDIIEQKFPYPNFKQIRLLAEKNCNGTMDGIYSNIQQLTNEPKEIIQILREFELQIEMENTIPIMTNIARINDGDILVSDMYLSHDEIRRLLDRHKINPNTTLYVSPGGKYNGSMWNKLVQEYRILSHTGDNYHSDILMAAKYNIPNNHTVYHMFRVLETFFVTRNFEISTFLRKFRLMNPYKEKSDEWYTYEVQICINIPILIFICHKLAEILEKENRTTVLFLSRDGCLLIKLFSFIYPQYKAVYLHSSRIINLQFTDDYISYLKENYNKETCLLFDLHGSFNSGKNMWKIMFGHFPRIFIFDLRSIVDIADNITYITTSNPYIENLNLDLCGCLVDYKNNKAIRMPVTYDLNLVLIAHKTVQQFIDYTNNKQLLCSELFKDDKIWTNYYINHCSPNILNYSLDKHKTLTFLANYYNLDKGSEYSCSHHYTVIYQEIISDILEKTPLKRVNLLEIGLNRDNTDSIPSLLMWNDYFNKNINITGFDKNPIFQTFNSQYNNIKIYIGDQSNENDLGQLKYKEYDIIIDDGYHASKHQQISFKTLWSSLKSCGYYIIEDLHYQPEKETCIPTRMLFQLWQNGYWFSSEFINSNEIDVIKPQIKSIKFYDSKSKFWGDKIKNAFVYIEKL